jgi:hypothetical protein
MPKREKRPEIWSGYLSIYGYLHTYGGYKYEIWIDMEWIDMEWIWRFQSQDMEGSPGLSLLDQCCA